MQLPRRSTSPSPKQAHTVVTIGFLFGLVLVLGTLAPMPAFAASPWENAVNALQTSFTGPIARGLSLVSVVVGGLTFAFAEGDSKRLLAGILFGVGMALSAVNFLAWLFPG
jgi:type IV secretory pathway VirB2 component (pilin)